MRQVGEAGLRVRVGAGRGRAVCATDEGGAFVGKIFQGAEFEQARNAVRARFETVRVIQPPATRAESYEIFLTGQGRYADKP